MTVPVQIPHPTQEKFKFSSGTDDGQMSRGLPGRGML